MFFVPKIKMGVSQNGLNNFVCFVFLCYLFKVEKQNLSG